MVLKQHCFNSKMVRLIAEGAFKAFKAAKQFQFQNGSINSLNIVRVVKVIIGFNSKMVRLIVKVLPSRTSLYHCFNSKMVRLIGREERERLRFSTFQFQNGSINRHHFYNRGLLHHCFNSKMVRLIASSTGGRAARSYVSIPKWFD